MEYIIFDLEWNNAYNYKLNKGINEIIEIGALKLDENLNIIDSFKQLIKPKLSKKLSSRFKNLTSITMDEIKKFGVDFDEAFADFSRWSRGDDTVFLSWSTSDLYTLVDNFRYFKKTCLVDFMTKYVDAQKYCMQFVEGYNGNQISLCNCAEFFNIDLETVNLHRALEDCYVTACCFKKVFNKKTFDLDIKHCDRAFFEKLVFKPFYVTKIDNEYFDVNEVELVCPECGGKVVPFIDYSVESSSFKSAGKCSKCDKVFWIFVRAKKTYDRLIVTQKLLPINKKRAKNLK